jgi:hypothetical protein
MSRGAGMKKRRRNVSAVTVEGKRLNLAFDKDLGGEALRPLEEKQVRLTLPKIRIRKEYSRIRQARFRYILGDDEAINDT